MIFTSFFSSFFRPLVATLVLTIFILSGTGLVSSSCAATKKRDSGPNPKYASIVIDAGSGMVLSQDNADWSLHPASLTKMMTMVLIFDELDSGKITQRTRLVATSHGASMPPSKVGLKPRQSISVYDALRVLATKSANDVAVTVAENLGGSETRFVQMMNLKARQVGMTGTRFVNASGLHDYRQVSTARDMARLAKYLIDTYPRYYSIFGLTSYYYGGKRLENHNKLMKSYEGMDGIKTGYVAASGFNLVASAKRGNTRLIGVVFGGRTASSRNEHMRDLLDRGFLRLAQLRAAGRLPAATSYANAGKGQATSVPLPPRKPGSTVTTTAPAPPSTETLALLPETKANSPATDVPVMKSMQITPVIRETYNTAPPVHSLGQVTLPAQKPIMQPAQTQSQSTQANPVQVQQVIDDRNAPNWQIQIGAYGDRSAVNQGLYNAMIKLPKRLNKGQTIVVPLRTPDAQWVFRARLGGYTKSEAIEACSYLQDCLTIGPQE